MPKLSKESIIKVGTRDFAVSDVIKPLTHLPAEQVVGFFQQIGLTIPRELRIYVLKETLRQRVAETRRSRGTLADELNYRLSWFSEFTETQLENLLVFFDDEQLVKQYLDDFWTDLLSYMIDKQVPANDIKTLFDLSVSYVKDKGLVDVDIKSYNRTLSVLFYDSFNRIDGLSPQKIRPVLYKSSTLNEIRDLGDKYGVKVPRRLKKEELANIIINEIKDKGEYTQSLENQIRQMSVLVLQRYAIDHDIKASTELKKEEIIEYILANAKETREAYFIPSSIAAYEQEIEEISDEDKEPEVPVKHEPEVEKVIAKVMDEEPEEEKEPEQIIEEHPVVVDHIESVEEKIKPQKEAVQVISQSVNLDALVAEVKALRETIAGLMTKTNDNEVEHVKQVEVKEQVVEHKVEEVSEELLDYMSDKGEPIIVNTAEFSGSDKSFKKILKSEIKEREAFVEQQKLEEQGIEDDSPGEIKALKKTGKFLLKFLRILLLKIVLPILGVAIVLLAIYGAIDFFTSITFFDGITNAINGFKIGGIGILDHYFHFLQNTLGLTPAA